MIGHYLNTLTAEQEDRVLTRTMGPGPYTCGCLVGTANDAQPGSEASGALGMLLFEHRMDKYDPTTTMSVCGHRPGLRYDDACERFGTVRVNAAIRNRILSNRARRTLQNRSVEAAVR